MTRPWQLKVAYLVENFPCGSERIDVVGTYATLDSAERAMAKRRRARPDLDYYIASADGSFRRVFHTS